MSRLNEMPFIVQFGIVVAVAAALTVGAWFGVYKSMADQNQQTELALQSKVAENEQLRPYEARRADMERQIASLKQQLDIQKRIVPDEKEAPQFMHVMQDMAGQAGIEVRRYTARSVASHEFFTEVPFEVELDGPYYGLLNFFDKVAHMERIVNVSSLAMSTIKKPSGAGVRRQYTYAPGESVVVTCVATTFFSHDNTTPMPAAAKK